LQRAGEEEPLELLDLAAAFHGDVGIGDIIGEQLRDAELHQLGEELVVARLPEFGGEPGEGVAIHH
jgi:hypothetical protein